MDQLVAFLRAREQSYWDLLARLVNIESPTEYKEGVDRIGDELALLWQGLGFSEMRLTETAYGDHRVLDRDGEHGRPRFLLVGHMDTVFGLGSAWPFRIDPDGRAYGPGAVDMKGGLVMMLAAVEALDVALAGKGRPSLRVLLNSDEEPGSPRSRELLPKIVAGCDAAFVLEPSEPDGAIVIERKGVGIFQIAFKGKSAHAGQEPELGLDANEALARALLEAKKLAAPELGTTLNPGVISGGSVPYAIAERSQLVLDVRVLTSDEMQRVQQGLTDIAERPHVDGVTAELTGSFHRPPMVRLPGAQAIIDCYAEAAAELGMASQMGISGAASDANSIVALGIPCLDGLGPIGGRAHSTEEYLECASLVPRTAILSSTLARLSEMPRESFGPERKTENA